MSETDVGVCVYGDLRPLELTAALNALHELLVPDVSMAFPRNQVVMPVGATGTTHIYEPLDKDGEGVVGKGWANDGTEILYLSPYHLGQQVEFLLGNTLHVTITRNEGDQAQPFRMRVTFMLRSASLNKVAYAFMDVGSPPVIRNASDDEVAPLAQAQT